MNIMVSLNVAYPVNVSLEYGFVDCCYFSKESFCNSKPEDKEHFEQHKMLIFLQFLTSHFKYSAVGIWHFFWGLSRT